MHPLVDHHNILSDDDLLHAREDYRPTVMAPLEEMTFAHWAERLRLNSAAVVARELAGLSEEHLSRLSAEFVQAPLRPRGDRLRYALAASVGLLGVAGLCAVAGALAPGNVTKTGWQMLAATCGALSLVAFCTAAISKLALAPLEMAYGKLGLLVVRLSEQHPWLYRAYLVQRHPAAAAYRARVLVERKALRGVDYVMMREMAQRHDGLEMTRTAREVAAEVQHPR